MLGPTTSINTTQHRAAAALSQSQGACKDHPRLSACHSFVAANCAVSILVTWKRMCDKLSTAGFVDAGVSVA